MKTKQLKECCPTTRQIMESAGLDIDNGRDYDTTKKIINSMNNDGYRFCKEVEVQKRDIIIKLTIPLWFILTLPMFAYRIATGKKISKYNRYMAFMERWKDRILGE